MFGQDLHGPFNDSFLSNLQDYQLSMQKLLDLDADILCEGHLLKHINLRISLE